MKNFKRFPMVVVSVIAFMAVTSLSGCESASEKELRLDREHEIRMQREDNGSAEASRERSHERSLAYIQRPVAPGSYIDYRGNTNHGYWNNGSWAWNNPQSSYASESRQYVDYGLATGVLATAVLTQALFSNNNSDGWQKSNVTVNNYTSVDNKVISKEKFNKRDSVLAKKKLKAKSVRAKTKTVKREPAKTVNKSTGIKKDSKWDSKRTAAPTYGKNGFRSTFQSNKQKTENRKNVKSGNASSYTKTKRVKSSYKKPTQKRQVKQKQRPKKQQRRKN